MKSGRSFAADTTRRTSTRAGTRTEDADVLVPTFAILKDVSDGATVGAAQRLKAAGFNDSMVDLGAALNIALAAGDGLRSNRPGRRRSHRRRRMPRGLPELWARVRETAQWVGTKI